LLPAAAAAGATAAGARDRSARELATSVRSSSCSRSTARQRDQLYTQATLHLTLRTFYLQLALASTAGIALSLHLAQLVLIRCPCAARSGSCGAACLERTHPPLARLQARLERADQLLCV
jgi:hypothetical protein